MKIVVVADLHLNKNTYKNITDKEFPSLPFRTGDFMRSFRWITDKCISDVKPDFMVICGDVYENFFPSNLVRGFFSKQLKKLVDAKIPVLILIGNHDVCTLHNALNDLEELKLPNIQIITSPKILDIKNTRLLLFPYSMDIERKIVTIQEEFGKFLKKAHGLDKIDGSTLFFGHFGVREARINSYQKEVEDEDEIILESREYKNRNINDLTLGDLDSIRADYVFLGDFHEPQLLKTQSAISMYCGSIEKNSFNEQVQEKGFVVYDDSIPENERDIKWGCCKFIKYENCRPMLELKGTMEEMKKRFEKIDYSKYQHGIIKVCFQGDDKDLVAFSTTLEDFKEDIVKKTKAIHIFVPPPEVNNEALMKAVAKMEEMFGGKDKEKFTNVDVIDVVNEIINEKTEDEEERKILEDMAMEFYKQVVADNKKILAN